MEGKKIAALNNTGNKIRNKFFFVL